MRLLYTSLLDGPTGVVLSRRNLLSLLAKLDGHPPDSLCTIEKDGFSVKAEPDAEHYDRVPGPMHPDTESALATRIDLKWHTWHRKWFDWVDGCPLCDPKARPK